MAKHRRKRRPPKRSLTLPDLEQTKSAVLNNLTSKSGQRTYDHAINEFVDWSVVQAIRDIGWSGWANLETDTRPGYLDSDMRNNLNYVRGVIDKVYG